MGSDESKASVLVYRHRHGEDITLHATPELALRAAGEIIADTYKDDTDARHDIMAMIAAGNFEEALDAWNDGQLSSSDPERIEISEDVVVQNGAPRLASAWASFVKRLPEHAGWRATWEYPGFVQWSKPGVDYILCATPDYHDDGKIAVEVQRRDGKHGTWIEGVTDVDWPWSARTPESYMTLILPMLGRVATYADEQAPKLAAALRETDPEKAGDTLVRIWKMCEESGDSNTTLREISDILAALDMAPTGLRGVVGTKALAKATTEIPDGGKYAGDDVFDDVIKAMQNAEEMGGPDGQKYIALMDRIAAEATKRAANYRARVEVKLSPMCPKCTSMGTDDLEIRETYSAYHPVVEVDEDGKLAVRNALATGCPSEHFDDGKSDYVATCRACLHEGTPQSFGLGDPAEWDWV